MALYPLMDNSMYLIRPSRLLDQHFGLSLDPEDFLEPLAIARNHLRGPAGYMRPWQSLASHHDTGSTIKYDENKFNVSLDVQQFKPEEITVKVVGDNVVSVEGKHEEKEDEHGYISRQFVRKYVLPKGYDISQVNSKLSSDGVLSISAPKVDDKQLEHREIPVLQTGEPVKKIQNKEEKKE
ncbi:unnamed protein product [Brassicogethes aeneus]|uniref:SHSP domain-containing protein n=1 Tax=Brassicogethes aeneus TaxID=1431903 RepID=A0A9P0FII6_BRAAE|nr:unnamed protein product [Brassicogethes aeneus]